MKVLVSTKRGQGLRKNDFSWVDEGEMVKFGFECDGEKVDGSCGCKRSMSGFDSLKATTTFTIKDIDMTHKEYIDALIESEKKSGWITDDMSEADLLLFRDDAYELMRLAACYKEGVILEKRGNAIQVRKVTTK
jgi:hypothetical protein